MTAEELCNQKYKDFDELDSGCIWNNIENLMIDFAKYHVQKALNIAAGSVEADLEPMGWLAEQHVSLPLIEGKDYEIGINRSSILNAYDLSNIK